MCHAIVWYHVLCQHFDQSQSSTIPCVYATATGYDCLPLYQPVLDLPLSGECCICKCERRWQNMQPQHRETTDKVPVIADNDTKLVLEERDLEGRSHPAEDGHMYLWIDGADLLATGSQNASDVGHDEWDDEGVDLDGLQDLLDSLDCSERESWDESSNSCTEDDVPDSPTLGDDISWWGFWQRDHQVKHSMIPIPVSRKVLDRVWDAYELELFNQLTF
ncbi:hypothetical protein N7520_010594 [Penicillium odoratum]|uniref:uncharacterized protein n=1 Tax=Penicillium odoratum TaxID=1167516 RepID=UPI002546690A|nr:uncharacterized protein N7520_010594 [Penicillium odoratum]KAJ5745412.1 hypothetical protein N7520_010594 [Penicillium odoratum]